MRTKTFGTPSMQSTGKLLATPTPFFDEAPSSWVQRICGAHQYSITRFLSVLMLPSDFRDFDLRLSSEQWEELLRLTDVATRPCWRAIEAYVATRMISGRPPWLIGPKNEPTYRWCPQCFACDSVPYLRWWWRFEEATHCPYHACELLGKCAFCEKPLLLKRAMLTQAGSVAPADTLAHCHGCGMPLFDPLAALHGGASGLSTAQHRIDPVRLLLKQEGGLQLSFHVHDDVCLDAPINRSRNISSWGYKGVRFLREMNLVSAISYPVPKHKRLLSFDEKGIKDLQGIERWCGNLSLAIRDVTRANPERRSRLAYALRVFREEKRALGILPVGAYMRRIQKELNHERNASH